MILRIARDQFRGNAHQHGDGTDPRRNRADAASGEFLKGIIERYGPARRRHPPLLFVHGFTGTTPRPDTTKALTWDLPIGRDDERVEGRTSSLTYFSDPATTDGRECWAVGYPNMDTIASGAAVVRAALAVICPKREGDRYPEKNLAGVGLAYKIGVTMAPFPRGVRLESTQSAAVWVHW